MQNGQVHSLAHRDSYPVASDPKRHLWTESTLIRPGFPVQVNQALARARRRGGPRSNTGTAGEVVGTVIDPDIPAELRTALEGLIAQLVPAPDAKDQLV